MDLMIVDDAADWHRACEKIAYGFAVAIDHGDFATVLDLFAENGSINVFGTVRKGPKDLRKWLYEDRPEQVIRHVCSNFSAQRLSQTEVLGRTYFTAYRCLGAGDLPVRDTTPFMIGEWVDRFCLTDAGWRLAHREVQPVFQAAGNG